MNLEVARLAVIAAYEDWHAEVGGETGSAKLNAYFAALATLEHFRNGFPIERPVLITANNQVAGIQRSVRGAMRRCNETRRLPTEMGRTTRSTVERAESLASRLNTIETLHGISSDERRELSFELENLIVAEIQRYLDQQALVVPIDLRLPGAAIVAAILRRAGDLGYGGPVAQHLVGAKLAMRFPDQEIDAHSFTAADQQTGRRGDFQIGASVFHVTVSEQPGHFQKCVENLEQGLKPYLLVLERRYSGAQTDFMDYGLAGKGALYSIESFVGQNMDELGVFGNEGLKASFAQLLAEYNRRIELSEANRGLLIQIPDNLLD